MRSDALKKAQKKYKSYHKRKYVEFDMRKYDDIKLWNKANSIDFAMAVKNMLKGETNETSLSM